MLVQVQPSDLRDADLQGSGRGRRCPTTDRAVWVNALPRPLSPPGPARREAVSRAGRRRMWRVGRPVCQRWGLGFPAAPVANTGGARGGEVR